jgi:hypothetical protein
MTPRERKLLDDQIEAEVLAELDDPSAWEEPIFVPPSKSPLPKWVTAERKKTEYPALEQRKK